MAAPPTVSVIMPTYNAAPFIGEAIGSVLAQDMPDFELLVVNDGSTDGTGEIVRSFTDPRVRVVNQPANLGIACSVNVALALSRGRFAARLDSDDIMLPHRLSTQVAFLEHHPEVFGVGSDMRAFGDVSGDTDLPEHDAEIKVMLAVGRNNLANPAMMFRLELVRQFRLQHSPRYGAADDLEFWITCMRHGAIYANIKQVLVYHRIRDGSASGQGIPMAQHLFADILGDLFPMMTREDMWNVACPLAHEVLSVEQVVATRDALDRLPHPTPTRYGENRDLLHQTMRLLGRQMRELLSAT